MQCRRPRATARVLGESWLCLITHPACPLSGDSRTRGYPLAGASLFHKPQLFDLARLVPARRGLYWVQLTARRSKALLWMGVGRVVIVKGRSGARAVVTVFRVMVARSAISVWKLWTGRPSGVRPVVCLATAAGDRSALATTLARSASAASLSSSS